MVDGGGGGKDFPKTTYECVTHGGRQVTSEQIVDSEEHCTVHTYQRGENCLGNEQNWMAEE
jgi:hypothetical protein